MSESLNEAKRSAAIYHDGKLSGYLVERIGGNWTYCYLEDYAGFPVSLTLPVREEPYDFARFPAIFEGLLPEGPQLEALLRTHKIDRQDFFQQLVTVGGDLVGSLSVQLVDDLPKQPAVGEE